MAGVFDIDIHDPDMGNNVDLDGDPESDDDVIEVEVSSQLCSSHFQFALIFAFHVQSMTNLLTRSHSFPRHPTWSKHLEQMIHQCPLSVLSCNHNCVFLVHLTLRLFNYLRLL